VFSATQVKLTVLLPLVYRLPVRDWLPASPQALEVEITLVVKSSFSCELPISELYGLQYIRSTEFSAVRRLVLEAQRLPAFLFIVRLRSTARHQTFFRLSKSDVVSFHCIPQKQSERSCFSSRDRSSLSATPGTLVYLECSRSRIDTIFAIGLEALDAIKAKRGVLPALV